MSKKTLKDGLERLFGLPPVDVEDETAFMGDNVLPTPEKAKPSRSRRASESRNRGSSSKSFTADLESLFRSVVSESEAEEKKKAARKKQMQQAANTSTDRVRRPMSGLDALIRQTSDTTQADAARAAIPKEKKRVTFVFDKKKLEQLKSIAKQEKAYLKDIIGGLISEFLKEKEKDSEHPLPDSPK